MSGMTRQSLRDLLAGGDRRSIGQGKKALQRVLEDRRLVAPLVDLAGDADWLVSMRALDLLEKLAHSNPDWVEPHKQVFIGPLADSDKWEVRLQIVRALPLFQWTAKDLRRVIGILRRDIGHPQTFVKAWATDSFSILALRQPALMPEAVAAVEALEASSSKALRTRARNIRERWAGQAP